MLDLVRGRWLLCPRYLQLCGGQAKTAASINNWCEQIHVEPRLDGSYGLFTRRSCEADGSPKNYLQIRGDNRVATKTTVAGWCEQIFLEGAAARASAVPSTMLLAVAVVVSAVWAV